MRIKEYIEDQITEYVGSESGTTSTILVGVHGNEPCGVEALKVLLPKLSIKRGRVFIGYGNPKALKKNVRYTEANLNRMFKPDELLTTQEKESYEYSRAQTLKRYCNESEALLDIHSSGSPESVPFLICEPLSSHITSCLPIGLVVSGFDAVEPGGTDYYMNSRGTSGICVECGYTGDQNSTSVALETMRAFLAARGHTDAPVTKVPQTYIRMHTIHLTKKDFVLSKERADFEEITSGEDIGTDGEECVRAPHNGIILFARNRNGSGEEAFLFGNKLA